MTLDGFLAAFAVRLHNLATLVASAYIACVFWGVFVAETSGYELFGRFLEILGLGSVTAWVASVVYRIEDANVSGVAYGFLCVWLFGSLIFLVTDFAGKISGNLLPQSAIATAFFWSALTDIFHQGSIWGLHTSGLVSAIGIIAFCSRDFGKEFWVPPVMATVALTLSPLYAVVAIPFWFAANSEPSETVKSTNRIISELEKLREAVAKISPPDQPKQR